MEVRQPQATSPLIETVTTETKISFVIGDQPALDLTVEQSKDDMQ